MTWPHVPVTENGYPKFERKKDLLSYEQEICQNNTEFVMLIVQKLLENCFEFLLGGMWHRYLDE
jgi:hypothetical protein